MGLQVRLRHALGERVLELPERTVDDPVVVGRAGDADVQIPTINVGHRHLVLFVHEGRWVAQNGPDATGTSVNGGPMPGAHVLKVGDVLTLGPGADAPTVGVESPTDAAVAAPPVAPIHAPVAPIYESAAYDPPEHDAPPAVADDPTAWMTADPTPRSFYTPKRRTSSEAAVAVAVVIVVAMLGGAGIFIYMQRQKAPPRVVTVVQTAPTARVSPAPPPRSMFTDPPAATLPTTAKGPPPPPDVTDELDKPKVATSEPADNPAPIVAEKDTPPEAEPAPRLSPEAEKAFKRVESTYWETDPARCLLAIDAFQAEFPGVETEKLEQYREDMLDKAWWLRVDSLIDRQNELKQAIKKTEQDIKVETEEAYRKTVLEPRVEDQKARLARAIERLSKEMSYTETTPPPIGDEARLQAFRAKRDKTIYDAWKARILKYVRDHHGSYPWATEK